MTGGGDGRGDTEDVQGGVVEQLLKGVPPRTRMWLLPGFFSVFASLVTIGFLAGIKDVADHPLTVGPLTVVYWPVAIVWARSWRGTATTTSHDEDSRVRPQDRLRVGAMVAVTAAVAGIGGWLGLIRAQAVEHTGARAIGTLVRIQDRGVNGWTLTVQFVPAGSESPKQFDQVVFDAYGEPRGEQVNVAYDPFHPGHARIVDRWPVATTVLISAGVIGGVIAILVLTINAAAIRRQRRDQQSTYRPPHEL